MGLRDKWDQFSLHSLFLSNCPGQVASSTCLPRVTIASYLILDVLACIILQPAFPYLVSCNALSLIIFVLIYPGRSYSLFSRNQQSRVPKLVSSILSEQQCFLTELHERLFLQKVHWSLGNLDVTQGKLSTIKYEKQSSSSSNQLRYKIVYYWAHYKSSYCMMIRLTKIIEYISKIKKNRTVLQNKPILK